jgi:hypothetical protein
MHSLQFIDTGGATVLVLRTRRLESSINSVP